MKLNTPPCYEPGIERKHSEKQGTGAQNALTTRKCGGECERTLVYKKIAQRARQETR